MFVSCPKCHARYDVPEEKLARGAVKIRCARCANLFAVRRRAEPPPQPELQAPGPEVAGEGARPTPEPPPPLKSPPAESGASEARVEALDSEPSPQEPGAAPEPEAQPGVGPLDDLPSLDDLDLGDFEGEDELSPPETQGEDLPEPGLPDLEDLPSLGELDLADFDVGSDEAEAAPEPEPLERVREEDLVPPQPSGGVQVQGLADDMPRLDLQRGPRRADDGKRSPLVARDRRRSPLFWVVVLAAVGAAGFTGYNVYRRPEAFTFLSPSKIRALWHRRAVNNRLTVQNLEGYYRDVGGRRVFVIRGEVWNRSKAPQSLIRVRGNLFDAQGNPLASQEVFCGNVLTEADLAKLPPQDIEARLQNEVGEGLSNMDIQPGARVPFMVVFLPAPGGATKFNVEVIQAREGASGG